ncbi:MAG: ferrous iron transporter B, partial [Clostridia bacterium]|nr:ferrous iron transporter B [Clostridia bacterium]
GVPVLGLTAQKKSSLQTLLQRLDEQIEQKHPHPLFAVQYPQALEQAIAPLTDTLSNLDLKKLNPRWLALKILDPDDSLSREVRDYLGTDLWEDPKISQALTDAKDLLRDNGISPEQVKDMIASAAIADAEKLCRDAVRYKQQPYSGFDRKLDRILTGKVTAYPLMLLLLLLVFFLTITVANYPSAWLSRVFDFLLLQLGELLISLGTPTWLQSLLIDGILKVLCWVVSVMLPPMAIFFPLFTLLEDVGYLPRIAYNLDRPFQRCNACGKQSLTMCMGLGCNAAGVVGCRIIDSPRERLLAILTNSFVPCNGRFPALIAILTVFFVGTTGGFLSSATSALLLTALILFSVLMTFAATKLLSVTLLRGIPSSFTLELPPYRKPQVGKVIVRSIFDRTLFVLGRSVVVAAPAGLVIWCLANLTVGDASLLSHCAAFLDPFANLMGLDGIILMAFILGLPANEIVIPLITMAYLAEGSLTETATLWQMKELFVANGWTWATAVSVLIFFLLHWPCSTTLLTVKKETGSFKWTLLAALLPTVMGMLICMLFTALIKGLGL